MVRIELRGVSDTPGDSVAKEGDLETSLGLLNDDGTLRPVGEPESLASYGGADVVFVHRPSDGSEVRVLDDGRWVKAGTTTDRPASLAGYAFSEKMRPSGVAAVGNTLCVATAEGVLHWLWKDGAYVALGERPELPVIEFDLRERLGHELDAGVTTTVLGCPPWTCSHFGITEPHPVNRLRTAEDDAAMAQISDGLMGMLLGAASENATKRGRFWQPFFVRYAFRLYDGSYSWHSSPVLMLAQTCVPMVKVVKVSFDDGDLTVGSALDYIPTWALHRRISRVSETLKDWDDIVAGVDIFVSAPIWTFRQSEDVEDIVTRRGLYGAGRADGEGGEVFTGHYEGADHFVDTVTGSGMGDMMWKFKRNETFEDEVKACSLFYRFESIDVKDVKAGGFEACDPDEKDLTGLQARATLPDEYLSHGRLLPDVLVSYNSRLHAAGLRLGSPAPFVASAYGAHTATEGYSATFDTVTVWSRRNGSQTKVQRFDYAGRVSKDGFPRYVYVPDPGAYAVMFSQGNYNSRILPLTAHTTLNGAYWWGGVGNDLENVGSGVDVTSALPSETSAENKVYVSEAGNPFVFRAEAVVTVGQASVKALAAAARPLSEGQFGQFPLYAFTDEGVWALETSATGSYSARQPITRDVLAEGGDVVSLDTSVAFVSERGLMRLGGRQAECLSEGAMTRSAAGRVALPGLAEAIRGNLHKPGWTPTLPDCGFHEYLRGARLAYDYAGQRLYVLRADKTWGWVLSLRTGLWGQTGWSVRSVVSGGYPDTLAMDRGGDLVRIGGRDESGKWKGECMLVTRPLRLGDGETLKTVRSLAVRGDFARGSVKVLLWGSRNLRDWTLVHSSRDHLLRGISGSGYRWLRVGVIAELEAGDCIASVAVEAKARLTRLN